MDAHYHPILYVSGKWMSLGEIPKVALKKNGVQIFYVKNRPRGAFLVTYSTLKSHIS